MRLLLLAAIVVVGFLTGWYVIHDSSPSGSIGVGDSYQYVNASKNDIFVTFPNPGGDVMSSVTVEGYARGSWYSEGVFPVEVKNVNGLTIGSGEGKANGEWITNDFVPFTAQIALRALYSGPAMVIISKGTQEVGAPSDASLSFPISIQ